MKKPNILFAIADDASHFGAYGHKLVNTPVVDALAAEGILFNNAFTVNPKCAPSRASILTGKLTWQLESGCTHFCEFPTGQILFPDLLEDNGYHIGYTGKGWGPGDFTVSGYTRNPAGVEYNTKTLTPPAGSNISKIDYAANFKVFMDAKTADQPFYFWYGGFEPHRKYNEGEGILHGKDPADVKVPIYLPDNDRVRGDFCDYAFEIDWFDLQLGKIVDYLKEIGEYDNTIIVVTSDNGCPFPRVKGQMYEDDLRLPLIITWKNGTAGGRVVDDLVSFIDFAPTFAQAAGVKKPESFCGKSLFDIFESNNSGVINSTRDRVFMGRERHDMGRVNDTGYPVRCIRTPQYLYIHNYHPFAAPAGNAETGYPNCDPSPSKEEILLLHAKNNNIYYNLSFGLRPEEQLFDIKVDSACMENLAYEESFAEIKTALRRELDAQLIATNDPRSNGNGDIFDSYAYVGKAPHAWFRLEDKYKEWLSKERNK
ncbi:sulfatase [Candidatus Epulonipiscium viviparus]|uniref:sulfatase family protein n=1 Tax=Candidatus Epulonipiscium viviparus TaxID=420336 RepID=UPI00016C09FD|nr:sulfatase [Candidatus Epulopiscium viviparus]